MSGYCKWCDTLTNNITKEHKRGRLVWSGCIDCYKKKKRKAKLSSQNIPIFKKKE